MRVLRIILAAAAVLVVIGGLLFALGDSLFLLWFNGPSGTLPEASIKFHAHRSDIQRISAIVRHDPALGWVTPGLQPSDMTDKNGPLTRQKIEDYKAISALLARGEFRDLEIVRDDRPSHTLSFMRFVIFGPGRSGSPKLVLAEWAAPSEQLRHSDGTSCAVVDDGWYVCPVDR